MLLTRRILAFFFVLLCIFGALWRYWNGAPLQKIFPSGIHGASDVLNTAVHCDGKNYRCSEAETSLDDGNLLYRRRMDDAASSILWLCMTYDAESWGKHNFHKRDVNDFLELLPQQISPERLSLGLLTSSIDEYRTYIEATRMHKFATVTIIFHQGYHNGPIADRKHRQDKAIQGARRNELTRLRNFLMLKTISDEKHILWIDADVHRLDWGIVERMIKHADDRDDVGMITARCAQGGNDNYDHNAWRGTREGPRGWDLDEQEIIDGELDRQGQLHVPALIENTVDDDLIELDVVGTTILYIRAALVWEGLSFATQYAIGTRWRKDGWDGIESEGLCYNARNLSSSRCMVMGGNWHVEHTKG